MPSLHKRLCQWPSQAKHGVRYYGNSGRETVDNIPHIDIMRKNTDSILLIIVGVLLLLSNLNILPIGELKVLLRQWWPLILIIIGIIQLRSR